MRAGQNNATSIQILLIEDNPGDVRLTQEALLGSDLAIRLHVARDGVDAMGFLRREGVYADSPRPDLILLDLKLPKMDGREVLARVKTDNGLKTIPIVVLTTSDADGDIAMSYELQANCYLCKPQHLDAFENVIKGLSEFWLRMVKLPPG